MNFGEYVKEKRHKANLTLRAFADEVGIAPSYASDIEKSKRNGPTQDILEKMAAALRLSKEETNEFYDLAASSKDAIAKDLTDYVGNCPNLRVALRMASEHDVDDKEWLKIVKEMNDKDNA